MDYRTQHPRFTLKTIQHLLPFEKIFFLLACVNDDKRLKTKTKRYVLALNLPYSNIDYKRTAVNIREQRHRLKYG